MTTVSLMPELQQFAAEAVDTGRSSDVGEGDAADVGLLGCVEIRREQLIASVTAAEAEGETCGFLEVGEVMDDADLLIAEMGGTLGRAHLPG